MKGYCFKILLMGLLFLCGCATQNSKINKNTKAIKNSVHSLSYDDDFLLYAETRWSNKQFEKEDLPKFDFLKSYFEQIINIDHLEQVNKRLVLSNKYLRKPSINNLIVIYLQEGLESNFQTFEPRSWKEVIDISMNSLPSENELLVIYYNKIFDQRRLNLKKMSLVDINIDFDKLELNNIERTILYLSAMRLLYKHCCNNTTKKYPENCQLFEELTRKLPKFNGLEFQYYKIPEFEDFNLRTGSYKDSYLQMYEDLTTQYKQCIELENRN